MGTRLLPLISNRFIHAVDYAHTFDLGDERSRVGPECRTIAEPATRLACYDKATPPLAAATAPKRAATAKSEADPEKSVGSQSAEDALVTARMNGICRGC
jgi:hypothetical protein